MEAPHPSPEALRCAAVLWEYHLLDQRVARCDAMLVLCSNDLRVADYAAQLGQRDLAAWIVFSGGIAHTSDLLSTGWDAPEADVFAKRALQSGLPPERVLLEREATNTGENFALSRRLLDGKGIVMRTALLVHKPFCERRALATGQVSWPDVELRVTSPPIPFLDYLTTGRQSPTTIIHLMVGDLQRLDRYGRLGFQSHQHIPAAVWAAYHRLVELGYDQHLLA